MDFYLSIPSQAQNKKGLKPQIKNGKDGGDAVRFFFFPAMGHGDENIDQDMKSFGLVT